MPISSVLGSSALLPAGLGFRNLIINGNFRVNQRGVTTTTSGGTHVFDRWVQWSADGTSTFSSQAFTVGNAISGQEPINFAQIVTSGQSAASAQSFMQQRIEDVRTCAGQSIVVSFWAKAESGTPKVSVEIEQNFGSGGSSTVNSYAGTVTISTTWTRYFVYFNVPSISGKTVGSSSFMALNLWVSSGSTNGSRNGSMGIQNGTFQFWGVQVEQNNVATPFENRPIGVELALCQRYYQKSYSQSVAPGTASQNGAITVFYNASYGATFGFQFRTVMRAAPSITLYSQSSGTISRVDSIGVGDATYTLGEIGDGGIRYLLIGSGTSGCAFHYTASIEL